MKENLVNSKNESGDAKNVLNVQQSNDSLISVIFPWRGKPHGRRRALVARNEAGRTITTTGFYLCMLAILLLCTGIGLSTVSVWTLLYRIPYVYLTDGSFFIDANSFTLCAGLVSVPCCWIAWICHDNKKNYVFLPLLMVILGFSLSMLLTGVGIGFVHRSRMAFDHSTSSPKLVASRYKNLLNESMTSAMESYDVNYNYHSSWNRVQQRLKCCGIEEPNDWLQYRADLPGSCYLNHKCSDPKILYVRGCLDILSYDLAWEICLLTGLSFISFCVQIITLLLTSFMYINEKISCNRSATC